MHGCGRGYSARGHLLCSDGRWGLFTPRGEARERKQNCRSRTIQRHEVVDPQTVLSFFFSSYVACTVRATGVRATGTKEILKPQFDVTLGV